MEDNIGGDVELLYMVGGLVVLVLRWCDSGGAADDIRGEGEVE